MTVSLGAKSGGVNSNVRAEGVFWAITSNVVKVAYVHSKNSMMLS